MHPYLTRVYLHQQRRQLAATAERHRIAHDTRPEAAHRRFARKTPTSRWTWLRRPILAEVH